jgi:glycosyltransferase involved in cell wall biosynthesis
VDILDGLIDQGYNSRMDLRTLNINAMSLKNTTEIPPRIPQYSSSFLKPKLYLELSPELKNCGGLRTHGLFKKNGAFNGCVCSDKQSVPTLVSVVTAVFNGDRYIRETILSVLDQSYENIEYIIIDGGSTDGTLDILREYDYAIDYWISEPDFGISDAFNKGINLSTGKIIGLINADDWYSPDAIKIIAENHAVYPQHILHGNIQFWTDQNTKAYIFYGNDSLLPYRASMNHPTVFVPREIYENVGLYSIKYKMAMDIEWLGRAKKQGVLFFHVGMVLANMRRGGISDHNWLASYLESMKARHELKVPIIYNTFLFFQAIVLTASRKILERLGFDGVIRFYRNKFSIGKKNNENIVKIRNSIF